MAQTLDRGLLSYRIGDPNGKYPIFDPTGSTIAPGRWNTPSAPMIYTSQNYSTAMLEKLVHGSGFLPPNQHFIEIDIPKGVSYEKLEQYSLTGWDDQAATISKAFGSQWQQERRSLLLIVPSVVARIENNILINTEHPEFREIRPSLHKPVWWDARLFG